MSFTCSFWIYINSWDLLNPRKKRQVMKYQTKNGGFNIVLGNKNTSKSNDLTFTLITHHSKKESITIRDIKLQKWAHICFVLEDRYIDIFINSELIGSKLLKGVPILEEGKLIIFPKGGFKGLIKHFQYFNRKISLLKIKSLFTPMKF